LSELYFSGTTSLFILHGSTHDLVRMGEDETLRYGVLPEFLAEQLFGRWDLVLHYELARGLRAFAGRDGDRLKEMVPLANQKVADLSNLRHDPGSVLPVLDRFVTNNLMADEDDRLSAAIIVDHASYVSPRGEPGHLSMTASTQLVTLLNWATSPHVKRINMAFVLVDEKLADLNERLVGNPHVAAVEVPLPDTDERERFIDFTVGERKVEDFSDFGKPEMAKLTAGISLTDVNVLIQSAIESGRRLDEVVFRALKKRLIERQCQGLLEFIEPKWGLDMVVGHEAAKARLREDAALLKRGALESLPMGYLLCEGNLERVLSVLRAMGPVVVVIDEADAALGDRSQDGDSGTSSRVFAMIAAQMGDTRYRGRILWMLLTCRPDLLPIDIKRQGRAEVHIPLFYPSDENEIRDLFVAMAKKLGATLSPEDVPPVPQRGQLSGADIEGMVGRAWRRSLLSGATSITRKSLEDVVSQFMPSTAGLEKELQETAGILECTDRQFLPAEVITRIDGDGGRQKLQARLTALRRLVESL
jgi:hypothetical protein